MPKARAGAFALAVLCISVSACEAEPQPDVVTVGRLNFRPRYYLDQRIQVSGIATLTSKKTSVHYDIASSSLRHDATFVYRLVDGTGGYSTITVSEKRKGGATNIFSAPGQDIRTGSPVTLVGTWERSGSSFILRID